NAQEHGLYELHRVDQARRRVATTHERSEEALMTTATTAKTDKTIKAATAATKAAVTAPFEAFNMNMPTVEVPAVFRDFAEKGIAQARDTYAKIKSAAEEATDMVEDTYETAREGAFAIGVKALDAA